MCYSESMAEMLKRIAIDTSSFKNIIETGRIYVDKTQYCLDMIESGKYYFLSRPRRFGKSLMVDTLANIFSGNKELFKDTYIYDKYPFESYPVIRLNMIYINEHDSKSVRFQLSFMLRRVCRSLGIQEIDSKSISPSDYFSYLIEEMNIRYGKQVVILIDEYDYSLMENVGKDSFEAVKMELANFYNILKAEEENIRFCFLTGVTRFPHVSIFSKLNNLIDITNSPRYAAICGYTDEELDKYFGPYMKKYFEDKGIVSEEERKAFRKDIKEYYDGYCFSVENEVTLYNPVSIGRFFMDGCYFNNYWISTGAQAIVDKIVTEHAELFREGAEFSIGENNLNTLKLDAVVTEHSSRDSVYSFLVQAGYLTIRRYEGGRLKLDYPNREVRNTMEAKVLETYGLNVDSSVMACLRESFIKEKTKEVMGIFHNAFVNIPYDMFLEKENNYQIAFYMALKFLGFEKVEAEEKTNIGRIDISVTVRKGLVYIIELKLDGSADEALNQIKEKKYYEKYKKDGNRVHLLGINFSSKERNISDWKEEII